MIDKAARREEFREPVLLELIQRQKAEHMVLTYYMAACLNMS